MGGNIPPRNRKGTIMKQQEQELTKAEIVLEWLGVAAIMLMLFIAAMLIIATGCTPYFSL